MPAACRWLEKFHRRVGSWRIEGPSIVLEGQARRKIVTETTLARPKIVSRDEWVSARVAHLAQEKAATQQLDRLRAERRRLPTVKLETRYALWPQKPTYG
jgi:hypothetical protein